jgi:type III pantothenate kinase
MLLTLDIGNSNITLGAYQGEKLLFGSRLVTERRLTEEQYAVQLGAIVALHGCQMKDFTGAIICSVVPDLTSAFQGAIRILTGFNPFVLGPGVKTGLNILIDNPAQLGADLVAGAIAAIALYPLPCVVFDLGTATTASVIDAKGNFLGAIISAGVKITMDALTSRTALLTHISLEAPSHVIGKNSISAMQSGLVFGTAAMMDGLVDRIEAELGQQVSVVATGGLSREIVINCRREVALSDNLVLEGLRMIFEKNARR